MSNELKIGDYYRIEKNGQLYRVGYVRGKLVLVPAYSAGGSNKDSIDIPKDTSKLIKIARRPSWLEECKRKALALPKEKRQEFLDELHNGAAFGEAREKCGISFDEASGILNRAIKSADYLSRTAD